MQIKNKSHYHDIMSNDIHLPKEVGHEAEFKAYPVL